MKKYPSYISSAREILLKPCEVTIEGVKYNAFCNSYSLALTTETCGEIPMCKEPDRYPPVVNLLKYEGNIEKVDLNKVIAEAKSKDYKLTKNALMSNDYLMSYDGTYYRLALVDSTYGIINDGKEVVAYHVRGARKPLTITTDIGIGVIMPVYIDGEPDGVVIEVH